MVYFKWRAERGNMRKKIEWRVKEVGTGAKWGQIVEYKGSEASAFPSNAAATPGETFNCCSSPPERNYHVWQIADD